MNQSAKLGAAVGAALVVVIGLGALLLSGDDEAPTLNPSSAGALPVTPRPGATLTPGRTTPTPSAGPTAATASPRATPTGDAPVTNPDAAPVQLTVRGRVVEEGGAPIRGAQVVLWMAAPRESGTKDNSGDGGVVRRASLYALRAVGQVPFDMARATSGDGGSFSLGPLAITPTPGARLNLSAEVTNREGETRVATATVTLPSSFTSGGVDAGDIPLTKLPAVRFVVRARGAPVEKATVTVFSEVTPPGWQAPYPKPQEATLHTDALGQAGYAATTARVAFRVMAPGFATEHGLVDVRPEGIRVSIDLEREVTIAGVVVDDQDQPVEGAQVEAFEAGGGSETGFGAKSETFRWIRRSAEGRADPAGRFVLRGLRGRREYAVYARDLSQKGQTRKHAVERVDAPSTSLRLKIKKGAELKVEARLPPGAQRPGRVSFVLQKQNGQAWDDLFLQHVGPEGALRMEFARIPTGRLRVSVHAPGFAPVVSEPIDVTPDGASPEIVLELQGRGRTLTGRVLDAASRPLSAAMVVWRDYGIVYAVTDGEGRFTLANLPADPLTLTVTLQGYAPKTVEVGAGGTTVPSVVLQPAR